MAGASDTKLGLLDLVLLALESHLGDNVHPIILSLFSFSGAYFAVESGTLEEKAVSICLRNISLRICLSKPFDPGLINIIK